MPKKPDTKWTVAIRAAAGKPLHKITKIISLNSGGFSVLTPYHKARSGFLFKYAINPQMFRKAGEHEVKWVDCTGFTAENRTKLSYHMDGFAQFSSENQGTIISGRDPNTGEPKGLGVMARPFSDPSASGPSIGISVWGLEDFELADQKEKLIIFEPTDFYYRLWRPEETNLWHLGIYVFPVDAVPPVRFDGDQAKMDFALRFPVTAGVAGSIVTLKTVRLQSERVHLGLYVESLVGNFPSKTGWSMHGPGSWTSNQTGYVLNAVYPRDLVPTEQRPSLDYKPPQNNQTNLGQGSDKKPRSSKTRADVSTKQRKKRAQRKSSSRT
ncbi:MAG: hypothetical protein ACRD3Q_16350 [Terriglobales bacterium]